MKKQLHSERSLDSILQILSINAFEQQPTNLILVDIDPQDFEAGSCNQLIFRY